MYISEQSQKKTCCRHGVSLVSYAVFRGAAEVTSIILAVFLCLPSFAAIRRKGRCNMKITIYYEDKNHPTILDVPDGECEIWVEEDYHRRLSSAEDKASVTRRSAQEIMDEDFNKPSFNSHQRETRRHVSLDAFDPDGNHFAGAEDVEEEILKEDYSDLHRAISRLKPKQRDLIKKVFWEDIKQVEIAKA